MHSDSSCCFQGRKVDQDNKDLLELQDFLDIAVVQVHQVLLDQQENVDHREHRALQEAITLDLLGIEVLEVLLDQEGHQVDQPHVYSVF